jgi:hypothetical protein
MEGCSSEGCVADPRNINQVGREELQIKKN